MRSFIVLLIGITAHLSCGSSGSSGDNGSQDGSAGTDATGDAGGGSDGDSGGDAAVNDAGALASCSVLGQSGCGPGEKCTWIRLGASASSQAGAFGCAPVGSGQSGDRCQYGAVGATTGYDDCAAGLVCSASGKVDLAVGECRAVCDPSSSTCGTAVCRATMTDVVTGTPAGTCSPACNPLTQVRNDDAAAACGSPSPSAPTWGCYGLPDGVTISRFSCELVGSGDHRDVVTPPAFINSCSPGSVPLLLESTGSSTTVCIALCNPVDTHSGAPAGANGQGPSCSEQGATTSTEECRYWWWAENPGPRSAASDAYGFCLDYTKYSYGGGTPYPSCKNLPLTGDSNPTTWDEAWQWACLSTASIPPTARPGEGPRPAPLPLRPLLNTEQMQQLVDRWR
jgi:hypothetical protein